MTRRSRAEATLFLTTFIWGGTFVVVKLALVDVSPVLLVAARFTLAALILLAIAGRRLFPIERKMLGQGCILGFLLYLGFVLQTVGLNHTTTAKSAFITGLMVIFTPLFQLLIEKRAPKAANIAGVTIVTTGLWFLTSPAGDAVTSGFSIGDALTLLCAVVFGLYIVLLGIYSMNRDVIRLTFVQLLVPAVLGWISLPLLETPVWRTTPGTLTALLYLAILANLLTLYVQTRYQRDTTPTRAAIIFTVEPLWAAILGYLVLGERMGSAAMLGGAMIIAGILVSELSDPKEVSKKE
ncbi:MAG TPA: DMT family transporter [Nitrospiria bacterium]